MIDGHMFNNRKLMKIKQDAFCVRIGWYK